MIFERTATETRGAERTQGANSRGHREGPWPQAVKKARKREAVPVPKATVTLKSIPPSTFALPALTLVATYSENEALSLHTSFLSQP